jgi:hypothetical protein
MPAMQTLFVSDDHPLRPDGETIKLRRASEMRLIQKPFIPKPFIGPFVVALVLVFGAFFFVMIFQST